MRISQEGIEPLPDSPAPIKDVESGHCYFGDFRIALRYKYNEIDQTSGVGVLMFAPNGLLWTQTRVYAHSLDEFASYYLAIDQVLEEAKKCKAKNITILVANKDFVHYANKENPYKLKEHNNVHNHVTEKLKRFGSYKFDYRNRYPKSVKERLDKETKEASEAPKFDPRGRWQNQPSKPYFNIIPDKEDEKLFAEQMARFWVSYIKNYFKEFEADYGKEKLTKLRADFNSGKIKDLPDVKRVKENQERQVVKKKFPTLKKKVLCQKCEQRTELEKCTKHYPEKELHYYYRCHNCKATQELNSKGRVLIYGKYPRRKN